jgi:tetratricopeptide (TPR) repeat protein
MKQNPLAQKWFRKGCQFDRDPEKASQAQAAFEKCLQVDRTFVAAYVNLGFIHLEKEDFPSARDCFQKAVQLKPDDPEGYNNLGFVYEKMSLLGSAKQMYEQALHLEPDNIEALINLAQVLEKEGDYHQAVAFYQRAIRLHPQAVAPRFCLATLYDRHDIQLGQGARAIELFQRLLRLESLGYEEVDRITARRYEPGDDGIQVAEV